MYDNRLSKTRKTARKAIRRLDLLKQETANLLSKEQFVKRLGFGPSERWRNAERLSKNLMRAKSEDEFWSATGRFRVVIETELQAVLPRSPRLRRESSGGQIPQALPADR